MGWEREQRQLITSGELREQLGATAPHVASRLQQKGVLTRVGRGVYAINPLRSIGRPRSTSALAAVAASLADEAYYLGGLGILNLHRLTDQYYPGGVDVFIDRPRRPRRLASVLVHFHVTDPDHLRAGVQKTTVEGSQVWVSDPERTVLDLLEYPSLTGGTAEAVKTAQTILTRIDVPKLVRYALKLARPTTCRRIGFLLERAGLPRRSWEPLLATVRGAAEGAALLPDAPKRGPYSSQWRLSVNDQAVTN